MPNASSSLLTIEEMLPLKKLRAGTVHSQNNPDRQTEKPTVNQICASFTVTS